MEEDGSIDFDILERELSERGVIPYAERPISTMVQIATFEGSLNLAIVFEMLPITLTQVTKKIRSKKKFQLEWHPVPGSILNSSYEDQHVGVVNSTKKPMKYSIALVMSISDKNITCKLYNNKLHMSGCKSLDHGRETVWHILNHLSRIKRILDWINANRETAQSVINMVSDAVLDEAQVYTEEKVFDGTQYILSSEYPGIIQGPPVLPRELQPVPADQVEFVDYLLFMRQRFVNHVLLKRKYNSLLDIAHAVATTNPMVTGSFECKNIVSNMMNHNYSLGFKVNREALNSIINGEHGFTSSFIHEMHPAVQIGLGYDTALRTGVTLDGKIVHIPWTNSKKKKKEDHRHTFTVWYTGQVTQSGPEPALCREAYLLFMKIITDYEEMIRAES